ncbi:MAG: gamma-glutamyltransferase family protein [Pseudomonadota bacterium]|nr:gamma-glutamyltransferase family protein [Pseudomonadota bacterium]MDQ2703544.1 gamma-glutamyltransferase family protein [Pseudomonadota bacterium]
MIATSHPDASLAGVEVLRRGGSAVDAAIAACAMQCVVEPAMTGIGGDCFALVARPGEPVLSLNGSGRSAAQATIDEALRRGLTSIADDDPLAVTIPGAVDAWCNLHSRFGVLGLDDLMEPAARRAEEGYVVAPRVAHDWNLHAERLARHPQTARRFLPNGRAPDAGDVHRQPTLAATLRSIGKHGREAFYAGPVAEDMVSTLAALGGSHTLDDFAVQHSNYENPISGGFCGHDVLECPPNGQGATALLILAALKEWEPWQNRSGAKERAHLFAQATRQAYRLRDLGLSDPDSMHVSIPDFVSGRSVQAMRDYVLAAAGTPLALIPPWETDTVCLSAVDRNGLAVSFINSLFTAFGSTILAPASGVMLHCRGTSFKLDAAHPNGLAPRKRPMHTIIPGMLVRDGRAVMPFGVMGGQFQAAGHADLIIKMLEEGMDIQEAIDAPRLFGYEDVVQVEAGVTADVVAHLAASGHRVEQVRTPLGGAQAVWIDHERGVLIGGSDSRKDGCALGY